MNSITPDPVWRDFGGWQVADAVMTVTLEAIPMPPGGFVALFGASTGLRLNDSGETVRLIDPIGQVVDEVRVPALPPGRSWAKDPASGAWSIAETATPEEPNPRLAEATATPSPTATVLPLLNLEQVERRPAGRHLRTAGHVLAAPGAPFPNLLILADGDRVLVVEGVDPAAGLTRQSWVEVTGWLVDSGVHARLAAEPDGVRKAGELEARLPTAWQPGRRNPAHRLVAVTGIALESLPDGLRLIDASGTVRLRRYSGTETLPFPRPGTDVIATGLVVEDGDELVLAPRDRADLVYAEGPYAWPEKLPKTGSESAGLAWWSLAALLGGLALRAGHRWRVSGWHNLCDGRDRK